MFDFEKPIKESFFSQGYMIRLVSYLNEAGITLKKQVIYEKIHPHTSHFLKNNTLGCKESARIVTVKFNRKFSSHLSPGGQIW